MASSSTRRSLRRSWPRGSGSPRSRCRRATSLRRRRRGSSPPQSTASGSWPSSSGTRSTAGASGARGVSTACAPGTPACRDGPGPPARRAGGRRPPPGRLGGRDGRLHGARAPAQPARGPPGRPRHGRGAPRARGADRAAARAPGARRRGRGRGVHAPDGLRRREPARGAPDPRARPRLLRPGRVVHRPRPRRLRDASGHARLGRPLFAHPLPARPTRTPGPGWKRARSRTNGRPLLRRGGGLRLRRPASPLGVRRRTAGGGPRAPVPRQPVAPTWVMPYFRGSPYPHLDRYRHLGASLPEILVTLVARPWRLAPIVLTLPKLAYLAAMLAPLGFLPLLAPRALAAALPGLAMNLLSFDPVLFNYRSQYQSFVLPFFVLASVDGYARLRQWRAGGAEGGGGVRASVVPSGGPRPVPRLRVSATRVLAFGFLASAVLTARTVNDFMVTRWWPNDDRRAAGALLREIPADVAVSVDERLVDA